jgi:hypothetical protein
VDDKRRRADLRNVVRALQISVCQSFTPQPANSLWLQPHGDLVPTRPACGRSPNADLLRSLTRRVVDDAGNVPKSW